MANASGNNLAFVKNAVVMMILPFLLLLLAPLIIMAAHQLGPSSWTAVGEALQLEVCGNRVGRSSLPSGGAFTIWSALVVVVMATTSYYLARRRPVFLVDFACYKPDDWQKARIEVILRQATVSGAFREESLAFMRKMLERCGIGEDSYVPPSVFKLPEMPCMEDARLEAESAVFAAVDELLAKTGVRAAEIGILVVNCSLHSPAPSLTSMVVNHYDLREDIRSYSLGGMGCSAGLISIDLAQRLLQAHRNTYALVVSTENMTLNAYYGNYRPMLVTNSIFRRGGAAVLLSNCAADRNRSKYQLVHTVRTHKGADSRSYGCVMQEEDDAGEVGIALSKDLMAVAGEALKTNITALGPLVLPLSEKLRFLIPFIGRKVFRMKHIKPYIPDFKLAFEHFCIHAGGRAVLDEVEKNMSLTEWQMEPSRMTLWRFGNTSSSSLWYELAYTEAKGRVKKGDRVWQIAFGSGFKCNSAVWKATRVVVPSKEKSPWMPEIDKFPVRVPKVVSLLA